MDYGILQTVQVWTDEIYFKQKKKIDTSGEEIYY